MVSALIPQFDAKFRQMELPQSIMDNDRELTRKIIEGISNSNQQVIVRGLQFNCKPLSAEVSFIQAFNNEIHPWARFDKPCRFQLK